MKVRDLIRTIEKDGQPEQRVAASRSEMKPSESYLVLYEKSSTGTAYAPDLPGCIAVGSTIDEVRQLMREGIAIYIGELQESGNLCRLAIMKRLSVSRLIANY